MSIALKIKSIQSGVELPVTAALARWNGKHTPESVARVQEVIAKDLLTADRGDGKGRLRPSSLHSPCDRMKILSYMGFRQFENIQDKKDAEAGTFMHYMWQAKGLSSGFLTDIEVAVTYEPWLIKGYLDGLMVDGSPFELKTMNTYKFNFHTRGVPKPDHGHLTQVDAYMAATNSDHATLVYLCRESGAFHEFPIKFDQDRFDEMDLKMKDLVKKAKSGRLPLILPDCKKQTGNTFTQCRWKDVCFANA